MDKSILKELKRLRNIRGTIVGEKLNGYRCEIEREIIEGFIDFLADIEPKSLEIDDMAAFLLRNQLLNLLLIDEYEVRLK